MVATGPGVVPGPVPPAVASTPLDGDGDDDPDDRELPPYRSVKQTQPAFHVVQRSWDLAEAFRPSFYPSDVRWSGDNACGACAGAMALDRLLGVGCDGPRCGALAGPRGNRLTHWIDRKLDRRPSDGVAPLPLARALEATAHDLGFPTASVRMTSYASGTGRPERTLYDELLDPKHAAILGLNAAKLDGSGRPIAVEPEGGHYVLVTGYRRTPRVGPDRMQLLVNDSESPHASTYWSVLPMKTGPLAGRTVVDGRWVVSEILDVTLESKAYGPDLVSPR